MSSYAAPFNVEERRTLRAAITQLPTCPRVDVEYHQPHPSWRAVGEMCVTTAGLICPDCGHTITHVDIDT